MIRIVDASAIGAVLFVEPEATWVADQTDGAELLAPGVLPFEIGNICWKRFRRSPQEADAITVLWTTWIEQLPVRLVQPNLGATLRVARETGMTFYDASYLQLAQEQSAALVSLDRRLLRAAEQLGVFVVPGHNAPRSRN